MACLTQPPLDVRERGVEHRAFPCNLQCSLDQFFFAEPAMLRVETFPLSLICPSCDGRITALVGPVDAASQPELPVAHHGFRRDVQHLGAPLDHSPRKTLALPDDGRAAPSPDFDANGSR